ncbi:MAG: CDP-alcohol phosphatidyltransferase family protein [Flavobacteriales bacterium]|nr:CDP-alcohol phosphatidyltransferase family protein [Flavobacteriales bacterium]
MKRHIPNIVTLANLFCGSLAAIVLLQAGNVIIAIWLVILAATFDFFDGFLARILKVSGEMGKQLDSLADMITFGLVPGLIAYEIMHAMQIAQPGGWWQGWNYVPLVIVLFSALRLARFNIDARQSDQFIGVPTPANTLAWLGLPYFFFSSDELAVLHDLPEPSSISTQWWWVIPVLAVIGASLMVAPMPMLALKFKHAGWKGNEARWLLIVLSVTVLIGGFFVFGNPFQALPIVLLLYLVISAISNAVPSGK